jgi:hypothetical protein
MEEELDPVKYFSSLPRELSSQIKAIANYFTDNSDIRSEAKDIYRNTSKRYRKNNLKEISFYIALLQTISSKFFIKNPRWYNTIYCYNKKEKHTIKLKDIIYEGKHVFVVNGFLNTGQPVVVKWYQSRSNNTQYEISIYEKLREIGCETPWFSSSYLFWDFPVLVMEKLEKVTSDDNEFEIAAQVIRQLMYIHQFGIHNDIKPGNIMKRVVNNNGTPGTPKYFMIDHGGVTTKKLAYGYRRCIWSPKWACQTPRVKNQVTTPKHDFIELGYTMKTIQNWRTKDKHIRHHFSGRLAKYMECVDKMNSRQITPQDYENLLEILTSEDFDSPNYVFEKQHNCDDNDNSDDSNAISDSV